MSEPIKKPNSPPPDAVLAYLEPLMDLLADKIAQRMEQKKAAPKEDRLLTVEQVCEILNCTDSWVYHNLKELKCSVKVGGMLRFSSIGLQRYIESAKFSIK
jgi:predicted DNA-binding transcriptional regulator AlpA